MGLTNQARSAAVSAPEASVSARKGDGGRKSMVGAQGAHEAQYHASRILASPIPDQPVLRKQAMNSVNAEIQGESRQEKWPHSF